MTTVLPTETTPSVQDSAPIPEIKEANVRGRVLMGEEVFATWVATALILAVMGTQFTSRPIVKNEVRIVFDLLTMSLSLMVLTWASVCHFDLLPHRFCSLVLAIVILLLIAFIIAVMVFVSQKKI